MRVGTSTKQASQHIFGASCVIIGDGGQGSWQPPLPGSRQRFGCRCQSLSPARLLWRSPMGSNVRPGYKVYVDWQYVRASWTCGWRTPVVVIVAAAIKGASQSVQETQRWMASVVPITRMTPRPNPRKVYQNAVLLYPGHALFPWPEFLCPLARKGRNMYVF